MAEEIKKEEPKIQLSAEEFIRAMEEGKAVDIDRKQHTFFYSASTTIRAIRNVEVIEHLSIENKTFKFEYRLERCCFVSVFIFDCLFEKRFTFSGNKVKQYFSIDSSTFNHSLRITSGSIEKNLRINQTIFHDFNIYDLDLTGQAYIDDSKINNELRVQHLNKCENFIIIRSEIKDFHLPIIIYNGASYRLIDIAFSRIFVTNSFSNHGYMQWNNLTPLPDAEVIIENAIMGKWDIVNCNFENVKMILYSSKITDGFYTNTKFPSKLKTQNHVMPIDDYDILRDGYNQLKTLAQKQNDRKMFLHYQAEELRSYYATLHWKKNFHTWFQLFAMKYSNYFGTSWPRGVVFVGIANLFFIVVSFSCRDFDITQAGSFIAYYFEFLFSVVRKPDFISGSWETTWYFISRIFIAFGIYQTVAAFRKFGKSE
jgi:hypothetical protein